MPRETLKRCLECKGEKMPASFHKDKSRTDGLCVICKNCMRNRHLKRYVPKMGKAGGHCSVCNGVKGVHVDTPSKSKFCTRCRTMINLAQRKPMLLRMAANVLSVGEVLETPPPSGAFGSRHYVEVAKALASIEDDTPRAVATARFTEHFQEHMGNFKPDLWKATVDAANAEYE